MMDQIKKGNKKIKMGLFRLKRKLIHRNLQAIISINNLL